MLDYLMNPDYLANSYCGIRMTQKRSDLFLWEEVLNLETHLEAIYELGTAHGGFGLFLMHQAEQRELGFATFDYVDPVLDDPMLVFGGDGKGRRVSLYPYFRKHDVLNDPEPIRSLLYEHGPVALFCDNGNKAKELELYADVCAPGSLIAVHDWNQEVFANDVPDCLREVYGDICDAMGSLTRFFRRRS